MAEVTTVVCCGTCDEPTIRITGNLEYIDHAGTITAYCSRH